MKHPVSRELFAYWDELRGTRAAPERGDLDPAAIRSILADTFMLEVSSAGSLHRDFPVRLSGTRLNALFTRELKGQALLPLWHGASRPALIHILGSVLDERSAVVAGVRAAPPGHPPIDLELLLLPLRHHGKTHERILGSLAPSHVPSWFGLLPAEPLVLTMFRIVTGVTACGPRLQMPRSYAPVPPTAPLTRHGRFRVYQGGR